MDFASADAFKYSNKNPFLWPTFLSVSRSRSAKNLAGNRPSLAILGWVNWARLFIWLAIGMILYAVVVTLKVAVVLFVIGRHHSKVQATAAARR